MKNMAKYSNIHYRPVPLGSERYEGARGDTHKHAHICMHRDTCAYTDTHMHTQIQISTHRQKSCWTYIKI